MKKTLPRQRRLARAPKWISEYTGQHIVKAYKKRFAVDQLCAMKELQMLGVLLDEGYVKRATESEMQRREQKRQQKKLKAEQELLSRYANQNDHFFFIAGYTPGGAPYGVTWEEMGLEPWEELQ